MRCLDCQTENPDQSKFCHECGARLVQPVCPQCGSALLPQAKFCSECGCKIGAPTPDCAAPIAPPPPAAATPDAGSVLLANALNRLVPKEVAERLLATRSHRPGGDTVELEGERRMVTMLFCDVKGSTAMAESLDPEDVMEIMNGAFDVLIPPVYRHEGTLARLMGDAILAFFGAPLSHEDDAARAVRAGLEIVAGAKEYAARLERERGIVGFGVRVGIHTGLVVAGEVGSDLRVEYTAMGDAINLAARMEQNAPVGGVLISHDTYQLVRGLFEVQALEPIRVKGKSEPVRVYLVQRARPRASLWGMAARGVEAITGRETRTVGREGELRRLQDAFYAAAEDGECQVVTVVGEAGAGKSRLLWEFEKWLDQQPQSIQRLHAQAQATGQGLPYSLLRDLFALRLNIQDGDPEETARARLEAGIRGALAGDAQAPMKAHLIGQLLGLDFSASPHVQAVGDDARQLRNRALIYVEEFLKAVAPRGTVVALFEDLHWADDSSLDAIATLARTLARQRLLMVCLARPALFDRRPRWGEGQAGHLRLDLQPLSRRDSQRLVDEILAETEQGQCPAAVRDLVVASAEGNPLYVEELIKVMIEQWVITRADAGAPWQVDEARLAELRVPPTLMGVLQARLDGLPPEQRTILQRAAVVGSTFWDEVVARIAERSERGEQRGDAELAAALTALRGRALVAQCETSAVAGSQEFVFKHAALRRVAYDGILKKVRRGYHSVVADWLIEQEEAPSRAAGERAGLIAEHLEQAGRAEEALRSLKRAAGQAAARFANAEAAGYYTRALALLPSTAGGHDPRQVAEEQFALLLGREAVYDLLAQRAEQAADLAALAALAAPGSAEGAHLAGRGEEERAMARRRAEVARRSAAYYEATRDYRAALRHAEEAVDWARQTEDAAGVTRGLVACGTALWRQDRYVEARGRVEQAVALARQHGDRAAEADGLHRLGAVAADQGDHQAAIESYEQALGLWREQGDPRAEAHTLNNLALVLAARGEWDRAKGLIERVLVVYQDQGDRRGEQMALTNLSVMYKGMGDLGQARELLERVRALARLRGDRHGEGEALAALAAVYRDAGDLGQARRLDEQAVALARTTGDRRGEIAALLHLGAILGQLGDVPAARGLLEQALAQSRTLADRTREAIALYNLGCLAYSAGDPAGARLCHEPALALRRETGERGAIPYHLTELAYALAATGDLDAAAAHFEEALHLQRELGREGAAVDALAGLAQVAARQGRQAGALAGAREALAWLAAHGGEGGAALARAYTTAADALAACGQSEEAAAALAAAPAWVRDRAGSPGPDMRPGLGHGAARGSAGSDAAWAAASPFEAGGPGLPAALAAERLAPAETDPIRNW